MAAGGEREVLEGGDDKHTHIHTHIYISPPYLSI